MQFPSMRNALRWGIEVNEVIGLRFTVEQLLRIVPNLACTTGVSYFPARPANNRFSLPGYDWRIPMLEKSSNAFHDTWRNRRQHREMYCPVYEHESDEKDSKSKSIYLMAASKYCLDSLTTSVAISIQPFKLNACTKERMIDRRIALKTNYIRED